MFRDWLLAFSIVVCIIANAASQQTFPVTSQQFLYCPQRVDALYCFLPDFGLHPLINAGVLFSVQDTNAFRLNTLLGIENSTRALPTPAEGITLIFDPKLGTLVPSRESFGPILSDRAGTLGERQLSVSFTYQHFGFDSLDGLSLNQFNGILVQSVRLRVDEFTTFLTYGLTRRIDVSVAFPVRTVEISAAGLGFDVVGTFPNQVLVGPFQHSETERSSGLSDITLRAKATVWRREHGGVAVGLDVRTPTGEPLNFLGSGAVGVRPLVIGSWGRSFHHLYIGPHLNVGYEWNGRSILGGALLGQEGRLPRQLLYAVGTEVGVTKRATVTLDLNGERLFNAERSYIFNKSATSVAITTRSIDMKDGSVGAKVNPWGNLLLTGNLSFRLDRGGLRARLVPLLGVSYTF